MGRVSPPPFVYEVRHRYLFDTLSGDGKKGRGPDGLFAVFVLLVFFFTWIGCGEEFSRWLYRRLPSLARIHLLEFPLIYVLAISIALLSFKVERVIRRRQFSEKKDDDHDDA